MQEFEGNIDHFNPAKPFSGDENVRLQFYMGTMKDDVASAEQGRPVFKDVEFIRIYGGPNNIVDRPIWEQDLLRFPRQYAHWKSTRTNDPGASGFSLEQWSHLTKSQVEELKYFKVFTVEQLAALPDSEGQKIMGFQALKARAAAFVKALQDAAPLQKMQEAIEARDAQIASLQNMLERLSAQLDKLSRKAEAS